MRNTTKLILLLFLMPGCAFSAAAREESKRDFRKSIPMAGGRSFRIDNRFGHISIHAQASKEVTIQATIRCSAGTVDEARQCADQIQIAIEETSAAVSVRTDYPSNEGRNISFNVDYDITLPDTSPLDLTNHFGGTEVSNLRAPATIKSGNGSVRFINGRGRQRVENTFGMVEVSRNDGEVTIENSGGPTLAADINGALEITQRFGEVRVTNAGRDIGIHGTNSNIQVTNAGGPANISNTFGNVTVSDMRSDVTVQNQNGQITANGVAGRADLRNSFAAIKFSRIGKGLEVHAQNSTVAGNTVGESAVIATTFGSVHVSDIKGRTQITTGNSPVTVSGVGGDLSAKTSFAAVTIDHVAGHLTVEAQNGPVSADIKNTRACQPVSIRTTFAPIRVTLPHGIGYNFTAHTTFGQIRTDPALQVTVSGKLGNGELNGKIAGGGCDLRLINQTGSIDID